MGYVTSLEIVRPFSPLEFTAWLKSKIDDSEWLAEKHMGREDFEEIIGHVPDVCQGFLEKSISTDDCGSLRQCTDLFVKWLIDNKYAEQMFLGEVHADTQLYLMDFAPDPISCILDSLSDEKRREHDEWIKDHLADEHYSGAIGGRFTYHFSETGLGIFTSVHDAITKDKLELTDYDEI